MNIQNTNNAHFITENKNRIGFLFLLFILSSLRMFGQTPIATEINKDSEIVATFGDAATRIASADSQIDFVGWFMGSRQSQMNEGESNNGSRSATKKQILTSGISPNKVLYRTFMKRVISQDSAIV